MVQPRHRDSFRCLGGRYDCGIVAGGGEDRGHPGMGSTRLSCLVWLSLGLAWGM